MYILLTRFTRKSIWNDLEEKKERVGNPYLCGTVFESNWLKSTKHVKTSYESKIINFEDILKIQKDFIF